MEAIKYIVVKNFPISEFPTVENDGSSQGAPCQRCDGILRFRPVRGGGFILGCSNFKSKNCRFKMKVNSDDIVKMKEESLARKEARALKRLEKELVEAEKIRQKEFGQDKFCPGCGECLSVQRRVSGFQVCPSCEILGRG